MSDDTSLLWILITLVRNFLNIDIYRNLIYYGICGEMI